MDRSFITRGLSPKYHRNITVFALKVQPCRRMLSNEWFCARTDVETKPTHTKEVPMSADNKVIVRRLFEEVFNKRNIALLDQLIDFKEVCYATR
jgi:hypothetical protein